MKKYVIVYQFYIGVHGSVSSSGARFTLSVFFVSSIPEASRVYLMVLRIGPEWSFSNSNGVISVIRISSNIPGIRISSKKPSIRIYSRLPGYVTRYPVGGRISGQLYIRPNLRTNALLDRSSPRVII